MSLIFHHVFVFSSQIYWFFITYQFQQRMARPGYAYTHARERARTEFVSNSQQAECQVSLKPSKQISLTSSLQQLLVKRWFIISNHVHNKRFQLRTKKKKTVKMKRKFCNSKMRKLAPKYDAAFLILQIQFTRKMCIIYRKCDLH